MQELQMREVAERILLAESLAEKLLLAPEFGQKPACRLPWSEQAR